MYKGSAHTSTHTRHTPPPHRLLRFSPSNIVLVTRFVGALRLPSIMFALCVIGRQLVCVVLASYCVTKSGQCQPTYAHELRASVVICVVGRMCMHMQTIGEEQPMRTKDFREIGFIV